MQVEAALRSTAVFFKTGYGNRRTVGGQDRFGGSQLSQLSEDLAFELKVFGDGFNHQIGVFNRFIEFVNLFDLLLANRPPWNTAWPDRCPRL